MWTHTLIEVTWPYFYRFHLWSFKTLYFLASRIETFKLSCLLPAIIFVNLVKFYLGSGTYYNGVVLTNGVSDLNI